MEEEMDQHLDVSELRRSLIGDLMRLLGLSQNGLPRHLLEPFLWPPTTVFARLASTFDRYVEQFGFHAASQWALSKFAKGVEVSGSENIPSEGPLLIVSNHPGTIDSLAIISHILRGDLKVVVTGIPFFQRLRSTAKHFIYTTLDPHSRMTVVRTIIRQLESGGALLIFPTGMIDPDPDIMPGASEALEKWSPSLDVILRRVPQTEVLVTIVSGVLSPNFLSSPLTRLHRGLNERQKVAEFLQVVQQLFFPKSLDLIPRISFAETFNIAKLPGMDRSRSALKDVISKAQQLLVEHTGFSIHV